MLSVLAYFRREAGTMYEKQRSVLGSSEQDSSPFHPLTSYYNKTEFVLSIETKELHFLIQAFLSPLQEYP